MGLPSARYIAVSTEPDFSEPIGSMHRWYPNRNRGSGPVVVDLHTLSVVYRPVYGGSSYEQWVAACNRAAELNA